LNLRGKPKRRSAFEALEFFERNFARDRVAHDAFWIIQFQIGSPWLMNPAVRNFCQLGTPTPNVIAVRIEFFALRDGVEDAEVRGGIRAAASGPLPAEGVLGEIGVDKCVPKPTGRLRSRKSTGL
jgi:hypothetical protein